MAAGQLAEARNYLLSLWEREPGNGTVNLELAHLAVRQRSEPDALRFFHGAIYGAWDEDATTRRRAARLELVHFLLDSGDNARAQAELIALAAGLRREPELQTQAGELMLRAGGYEPALTLFRQAWRKSLVWKPLWRGRVRFASTSTTSRERSTTSAGQWQRTRG